MPLLLDDGLVDLAGGEVAVAAERGVGEALVVAQVEVGFGAVVEDVDLAVLVGTHRPRIDVEVGVELLEPDAQAAVLQQHADRGAGEALAEGTHHAAGDENVLGLLGRGRAVGCQGRRLRTGTRTRMSLTSVFSGSVSPGVSGYYTRRRGRPWRRDGAGPPFTRSSRGPTLPILPPRGDETPVVVVGVHAGRAVADDADLDVAAVGQDAQLFQFFQLFQRVRRQVGQGEQKATAIGVNAEVLEEARRAGGEVGLAVADERDGAAAEVEGLAGRRRRPP